MNTTFNFRIALDIAYTIIKQNLRPIRGLYPNKPLSVKFTVFILMEPDMFKSRRNSKMELGEVYFWTNTIKDWKNWKKSLDLDIYKQIIIEQLQWLVQREKIAV